MSHHTFVDQQIAYNSGSLTSYFDCASDELISLQVTKTTTGSLTALRIETSNHVMPSTAGPYTGSAHNGLWSLEEGPHSGTLLHTASLTQASTIANIGNIGARFVRTVLTTGHGDVFKIVWHGKGNGR